MTFWPIYFLSPYLNTLGTGHKTHITFFSNFDTAMNIICISVYSRKNCFKNVLKLPTLDKFALIFKGKIVSILFILCASIRTVYCAENMLLLFILYFLYISWNVWNQAQLDGWWIRTYVSFLYVIIDFSMVRVRILICNKEKTIKWVNSVLKFFLDIFLLTDKVML